MPQQIPNTGANARTLDTFKSKMLGGGVRPNFFEVELKFPALAIDDNDIISHRLQRLQALRFQPICLVFLWEPVLGNHPVGDVHKDQTFGDGGDKR